MTNKKFYGTIISAFLLGASAVSGYWYWGPVDRRDLIIEERNLKIEELQGQLNKSFDTISNIGSECIDKVNDAIERVEKENQKEILSLKNDIDLLRESINIYKQKLNDREIAISVKNLEIESLKNTIKENAITEKKLNQNKVFNEKVEKLKKSVAELEQKRTVYLNTIKMLEEQIAKGKIACKEEEKSKHGIYILGASIKCKRGKEAEMQLEDYKNEIIWLEKQINQINSEIVSYGRFSDG